MQPTREIQDGEEVLVYPNGLIKSAKNGQILKGPDNPPITKENAAALNRRRYQLAREAALKGIDEAAIEAGLLPPTAQAGGGEGWRAVVRHVTATLLQSKNLRGQAEAANFLAKATGLGADEARDGGLSAVLASLAEMFERLNAQTVEGKVTNVKD